MQKKNFETVLYSLAGVIIVAAIVVAFNVITAAMHRRVDLTAERAFTLTDGTRAILAKLDTPVKIRFYCTQGDAGAEYALPLKSYARVAEDLLAEYQDAARGKIIVEKLDPQPDSDAEDSARLDGIEEQTLPNNERFYLGLAVSQVDSRQAIPFLSPERERQLEYDISRAIARVVAPERPVIGVMSGLPVFGAPANPMMMQAGQRGQEPWALISELKNDFTLRNVELDAARIDDDVKVLLVIHPSGISDATQFAIDQFVLRGGKLIAFLDPQSLVGSQGQNPMMGMTGGGSSLDKLLKAWGLQLDTGKVVADRTFKLELGDPTDPSRDRPVWLGLSPPAINSNDVATAELDSVWYFAGGAFTGTPAAGLNETVLLRSSKDSQLVDGMMANFAGENILKEFKASGTEYALAVRLAGKFKTAFPDGKPEEKKDEEPGATNHVAEAKPEKKAGDSLKESREPNAVVLVGDADMLSDNFTLRRMNTPFGPLAMPMNANLNFAQNVIEQLAGDKNLITVRSRALVDRPLTRVKALQEQAEQKYLAKIKELQESREQAENRINELQQQKNSNQRYILSPEQQAEIDNQKKKEAEIGKELHEVKKEFSREVRALQQKVQLANILAMPVIVCLTGIVLALFKRKRTSAR